MTTPTTEQPSTSIQLWPSGDSVEFRGDPDGPPAQRAIRRRNERNECRTRPWTTGDDDLWRVSTWFCRQLDEIGEVTISNGYGSWWGRCCTGQNYICDGTLQCVAARFEEGS